MTKDSYTWQEILSQPQVWRATWKTFTTTRAELEDFLTQADLDQVIVVGCGSTHYLAQAAAATLTHRTGIPTRALPSSELWLFSYRPSVDRTLLLAVSRSGTTTETLRAIERFREANGGPVLAVTCYPESPLAHQADFALVASDARELSLIHI